MLEKYPNIIDMLWPIYGLFLCSFIFGNSIDLGYPYGYPRWLTDWISVSFEQGISL